MKVHFPLPPSESRLPAGVCSRDRRNRAAARVGLLLTLLFVGLTPALGASKYWLSPGPGQPGGSGTEADPWITPTATEFDARLRQLPPDAIIQLGAGAFETHGWGSPGQPGFLVKTGWTLQGAGMEKTTVRLVGCVADQQAGSGIGRMFFSGWGPGVERVVMRDFTADCNHTGVARAMQRTAISLEAINLMGREFRIERVRAINALGRRGAAGVNPESFIIAVAPRDDTTDATGYWVEDCVVDRFGGGDCTAIGLLGKGGKAGATGAFRRNQILLDGKPGRFGFSAHGTREFVIENNRTRGTSRAFNWDTPAPGHNLLIRSNEFLQCTGWALNLCSGGDSIIENNLIELSAPESIGVHISGPNSIFGGARPWIVRSNQFRARGNGTIVARFYEGKAVPGCVFEGNRLQGRLKVDPSVAGFTVWRNNRDAGNRVVRADR